MSARKFASYAARSTALALSLITLPMLYPSLAFAQDWPDRSCAEQGYWLEFTSLQICVDRAHIASINHLNLDSPSVALRIRASDGVETEVGMVRLSEERVTGGLHTHLGIGVQEVFDLLMSAPRAEDADKLAVTKRVMNVDDTTVLRQYSTASMVAYAIIRDSGDYSSVYVFQQGRRGAIKLGGVFDLTFAEELLSMARQAD